MTRIEKYLKLVNQVRRYENCTLEMPEKDVYEVISFPLRFPAALREYIEARHTTVEIYQHSITLKL